jgi:hypothetical protein
MEHRHGVRRVGHGAESIVGEREKRPIAKRLEAEEAAQRLAAQDTLAASG